MTSRATLPAATALLLVTLLSGCAPAPAPTPTATPAFSTEAEAFAAAEETYRSYVEALNAVDLSDPETFEDVYAWTTGETFADLRETLTGMHADELVVAGNSKPVIIQPRTLGGSERDRVELAVCLDVSAITLTDASGKSAVSPDRPDVQSLLVTLETDAATETGWVVSSIAGREGKPTCA